MVLRDVPAKDGFKESLPTVMPEATEIFFKAASPSHHRGSRIPAC